MNDCKVCDLLNEIHNRLDENDCRGYWVLTELFILLHDEKDRCENNKIRHIVLRGEKC